MYIVLGLGHESGCVTLFFFNLSGEGWILYTMYLSKDDILSLSVYYCENAPFKIICLFVILFGLNKDILLYISVMRSSLYQLTIKLTPSLMHYMSISTKPQLYWNPFIFYCLPTNYNIYVCNIIEHIVFFLEIEKCESRHLCYTV